MTKSASKSNTEPLDPSPLNIIRNRYESLLYTHRDIRGETVSIVELLIDFIWSGLFVNYAMY